MNRQLPPILLFTCLGLVLLGCAGAPASAISPVTGSAKEVTVFAASSLTDAFGEIAIGFSARAGARVTYNFGGSNTLRSQVEQGARADVFASANQTEMSILVKKEIVAESPSVFATNRLVVITPKSNPGKIQKLQDLGNPGLKIVAAGPTVPAGGYTLQVLDKMNADPAYGAGFKERFMKNVISQELDVKQVVAKIQLGEGDAGIVYSTDVTARIAPEVVVMEIPDAFNAIARYPIVVLKDAREADLARAFVDYAVSADGQAVLKKHGFGPAH